MAGLKCLDSYALVEIVNGNGKFMKYMEEAFVVTNFTLAEFYLVIYKRFNMETAEYWFKKLERYSVSLDRFVLKKAVVFKYENRGNNVSIYDAVRYIYSLENKCDFVTGDKEFKGLKGVEFVKK